MGALHHKAPVITYSQTIYNRPLFFRHNYRVQCLKNKYYLITAFHALTFTTTNNSAAVV